MNTICIDQGTSNTRYVVNEGKIEINPNNAVFVDEGVDTRLVPNSNDIKDNLDFTIYKTEGESDFFPCRALVGNLAHRYKSSNIRPSVNMIKSKQKINFVSVILATAIAHMYDNLAGGVTLIVDFPPLEVNRDNAQYVKKQLVGSYKVKFNTEYFTDEVVFTVNDAKMACESAQAAISFFYNNDGTPRVEFSAYRRGYILSCDIGAGTSDFALIEDGRYNERTGQTYGIGGNIIKELMRNKVRAMYGSELSELDADQLVMEGRLPYGSGYKNMGKELEDAKRDFADMVVEKIDSYFKIQNMSLSGVKAIFVSGGGSMKSSYFDMNTNEEIVTSDSVAKYISEALKNFCDGVDVIEYPGENPRTANITGTVLATKSLRLAK